MRKENDFPFIVHNIPFFSQRLDKLNYKDEGFTNIAHAKYWSSRICGLACIKMAISGFYHREVGLAELLKKGLEIGGYTEKSGWYHNALVDLAKLYGLSVMRESIGNKIDKIGEHIKNKEIVIASVTAGFETSKRGGHLVVIFGAVFDSDGTVKSFVLHHPSSWKSYEWPRYAIDRHSFENSFSSAGNIIRICGASNS